VSRFARSVAGLAWALGTLGGSEALAQSNGFSTDVELVRPTFGHRSIQGVEVPGGNIPGTVRYGLVGQYALNPVTLYDFGQELGPLVRHRYSFGLGVSADFTKAVSATIVIPAAYNSGSYVPTLAAPGFGMGDLVAGARFTVLRHKMIQFGPRVNLYFPTGRKDAYIGENSVRGEVALMGAVFAGPLTVATDLGVMLRANINTENDFNLGPELQWNSAVRFNLPVIPVAIMASTYYRGGFQKFITGGAENSIEAMGGVQFRPIKPMRIDISAGRGFSAGYGTSDIRILGGLIIEQVPVQQPPPPPPPPPVTVETVVVDEIPEPEIEPPPEPEWEEGELARIVGERIQIREMLQFKVDTNILLSESLPVAQAIANVVNKNALIGHVVVEGHASEEGSYEYNYKLSESRARAIFEKLVELGVHPSRLSYRGMGEVVPLKRSLGFTPDEATLQVNRRVEFHIVRQYEPGEELPKYAPKIQLPWTGAESGVIQPPEPPKPEVKPVPKPGSEDDVEMEGDKKPEEMKPDEGKKEGGK
jgi:outer membrane protein OmpA-like peptidoglycan-associated protein